MKRKFIFETLEITELPMQLGIVIFSLYFGVRFDYYKKDGVNLTVYCGKKAFDFGFFQEV